MALRSLPAVPSGPKSEHTIRARELTKTYRDGAHVVAALDKVDVDIRRGDFVAVTGPSGSGKSTFLNQVGLLDTPTSGRLQVAGRDVAGLDEDERATMRARSVGFIFQSFNLMSDRSAIENVALPMMLQGVRGRTRRRRAEILLERVGLGSRMHHRARDMSGGQRQRVAVARALALEPPILLADEPTGNLDRASRDSIMDLFRALHRSGRTILMVTHDDELVAQADRILRFDNGRLVGDRRRKVAA